MCCGKLQNHLTLATLLTVATLFLGTNAPTACAQAGTAPQPSSGFKPIGAPSAVDNYRPSKITASRPQSNVVPASFAQDGAFIAPDMMSGGSVAAPVTGQAAPPVTRPSASPAANPRPQGPPLTRDPASVTRGASPTTLPQTLPQNSFSQNNLQPVPSSASDMATVPAPQLNSQWSTTGNSPLVTSPSGYRAVFWDCGTPTVMPTGGNPYVYAPPTVMPNSPQAVALTSYPAGYRPIFTLGQENYNVQLGQGVIGQPVVYVPGQPVRNFFRYLFP